MEKFERLAEEKVLFLEKRKERHTKAIAALQRLIESI
jgi:hypothetical protein